jgi:hypothetical protein
MGTRTPVHTATWLAMRTAAGTLRNPEVGFSTSGP